MSSEAFEDESVRRAVEETKSENPFVAPKEEVVVVRRKVVVESTLEEPVGDTILRDLKTIARKIRHVMMPYESQLETLQELREWDLWGPLFIGLTLALLLARWGHGHRDDEEEEQKQAQQNALLFSLVFVLIWAGAFVVTVNAALLGGNLSFFQSVCVLGYSVFPLCLARAVCLFLELFFSRLSLGQRQLFRLIFVLPALLWCTKVSVLFIGDAIVAERRALATYPVLFFYSSLAWMVVVVP